MKKIFIALLAGLYLLPIAVEAKYRLPDGIPNQEERNVSRRLRNYGKEEEGTLTLDEYKQFRQVRTVEDRREERRAKKRGTYVSPEDAFKAMDKDGDGKITAEDMLEYERGEQEY